jgi:hypothetical protein
MGGGGDGLHVQTTPENMLNKHSRVTDCTSPYSCTLEVQRITTYLNDEQTAVQTG